MLKTSLKRAVIVIGFVVIFVIFYMSTGYGKENTQIDYLVYVDEESHQLEVKMTIQPKRFLFFDLVIDYYRSNSGDLRITDFEATRGNKTLANWHKTPNSIIQRIWIGLSKSPITVTYRLDPQVAVGDRGKMLSYLTDDYGYFRGKYVLYTPVEARGINKIIGINTSKNSSGAGSVEFILPEDWQINDPWFNTSRKVLLSDLENTYWSLGKNIKIEKANNISVSVISDKNEDQNSSLIQNIVMIRENIEKITGFLPKSEASFWTINVLPPVPIYGGASGSYSLLTNEELSFIAHEMFHWWNGITIQSDKESKWLKEGFTRYYEGKVLHNTGVWSDEQFDEYIRSLRVEVFGDNESVPINLVEISKNYTINNNSIEDYYKLYDGGALLANYIDKELRAQQKSLDDIWNLLYKMNKVITSEDFLDKLESITSKAFAEEIENIINGKTPILLK